jgi:glutathione synthase/RimK-type ligase-like ATP-grasp enzyme
VKTAVALVTARAARGLDEDMPPLLAAFASAGAHAEIVDWDDPEAEWGRFDAALLRSAWDYTERLPEFLDWIERVDALTALLNPAAVLRWSADKHYLRDLERLGVPVVTTTFAEPGADAREVLSEFLGREACAELVVKPAVGAGSRDTRRHARASTAETTDHVRELLDAHRAVLLQPYFEGVDQHGETALIYINGRFSHAIRKGPLLPLGAPATDGLFAPETITRREPGADERAVADRTLAALPCGRLLYARVDLIRDAAGKPCVLELELAEPSLFLAYAPGCAEQLASATLARCTPRARPSLGRALADGT